MTAPNSQRKRLRCVGRGGWCSLSQGRRILACWRSPRRTLALSALVLRLSWCERPVRSTRLQHYSLWAHLQERIAHQKRLTWRRLMPASRAELPWIARPLGPRRGCGRAVSIR